MGSLISAGLQAAGLVLDLTGKSQQANATHDQQQQQHTAIVKAARQNYEMSLATLQFRGNQDRQVASQQSMDAKRSFLQAQGQEKTNLAAHGIGGGNTVDALMDQFGQIEATNQLTIAKNLYWQQQEVYQQELAAKSSAIQQINLDLPTPVTQPNYLAAGLQGLGLSLNAFDKFLQDSNPNYGKATPATPAAPPPDSSSAPNTTGGSDF